MSEKKKTKSKAKTPAKKKPAKAAKAAKARKKAPAKSKATKGKAAAKKTAPKTPKKAPKKAQRKIAPKAPPAPVYEHVFDNPLNVKRTIRALFGVCGILLILDFFIERYVDHPWEGLFGYYAIYGFVACVLLVLAAKEMRKVLMRGEDYYDE